MNQTVRLFARFRLACAALLLGTALCHAADFREETIYFVMTDRFVDGDPGNNNIYGDEYAPGNLRYYQGGDFKGLIANLDYIRNMGFTALWITPPVMQPPGRYANSAGTYDAAGYHGYWAWDFSRIDPHLESEGASYRDLIDAAHARGLKIIQDVVANHGHGGDTSPSVKWHAQRGELRGLGRTFNYHDDKEKWFNHSGPALADLLDLNDENPAVLKWFAEIYRGYQALGVDAFRLDTVVWMKPEFWRAFTVAMRKNKKDFFIFGEIWTNSDYRLAGSYTRLARGNPMRAGMAVADMPGSSMGGWGRLEKVFKGGDYSGVDEVLKHDGAYRDATWLVTGLDNHDKPRFNGEGAGGSPASAGQYFDALNFYFMARGIPCVYYGTEIMMPGGDDPDNRRMLGPDGIKKAEGNPIYAQLRKLNALRRASPALQKGKQKKLYSAKDQYAFRRDYNGSGAFVFLNKADTPALMSTAGVPDGIYTELYTGLPVTVKGGSAVEVPPHGLRVLARKRPGLGELRADLETRRTK
jgi:cyclomaltodextrin glucanotransferase